MESSGKLLAAAAAFVENISAVGVCSNEGCLNAFNPSAFSLPLKFNGGVPVLPPTAARLETAITAEVFPLGLIGRQLCSSVTQLGFTVKEYVAKLFTSAQHQFGCSLETLLHSLWILERIQTRNILAQQKGIIALRNGSYCRFSDVDNDMWAGKDTSGLILTETGASVHEGINAEEIRSAAPLVSSVSSEMRSVGPMSDVGDDDSLCTVCTGSRVFSLQPWNVQLFIAASLLLSIKVNEDAFAEVDSEMLTLQFGTMAGCEFKALLCAERCVCELIWDELRVTRKGIENVMRRLGMRLPVL
ncbi:hypothetical protein TcYC6_0014190 [Trypanosoma cruzi]|nr:hypothetical protein TcYC6_0014190 [Trypanosoma cruzi]